MARKQNSAGVAAVAAGAAIVLGATGIGYFGGAGELPPLSTDNPTPVTAGTVPHSITTTIPSPSDNDDEEFDRRREFGGWRSTGPGCDTRDDILRRDLTTVTAIGCNVTGGVGTSQYTGQPITEDETDIDHLFPLKAAYDDGAGSWTPEERREFANNPANLLAVDASSNRSKGDKLPSAWMPGFRACEYGQRVLAVAQTPVPSNPARTLPLDQSDLDAVSRACR